MQGELIGIFGIVAFLILLAFGVHVAIALAAVSLVGLTLLTSLHGALSLMVHSFYSSTSNYSFVVLPLFIIMGDFAASSGVTEKAYDFASKWLSQLRGGLYLVTTAACALFAAVSGSATATTLAIGKTVLPEMKKYNYDRKLSVACVAASGTLGVLIPPSIVLVIYGIVTEEPIGRLLLAGVLPGVLSALVYMIGIYLLVRIKPDLAPPTMKHGWTDRVRTIPGLWGIGLLFGVIIGGIYSGAFTATEAGAIGAFVAILLLAGKTKGGFLKESRVAAWDTAVTMAMLFFIIVTAVVFTTFLTLSGVIDSLMAFASSKSISPSLMLIFFVLVSIILGMFVSGTAMILVVAPIAHHVLVPLGYDGIWLGIIMVKMFELGAITPPVGLNVFVAKTLVPDMGTLEVFQGIGAFAFMEIITIVILILFPAISTFLPTLAFR